MASYDIMTTGMPPHIIEHQFKLINQKLEHYEGMLLDAKKDKDKLKTNRARAGLRLWSVYSKQLADYEALLDIPF